MKLRIVAAALVLTAAMDAYSTRLGLQRGAREANPVTGWVIDHAGIVGMMAARVFLALVLVGVLVALARFPRFVARWVVPFGSLAAIVWALVAMHNLWWSYTQA